MLEDLPNSVFAKDAAIIAGTSIGVVTFWKTVVKPLFTVGRHLTRIYEALLKVQYELKPNGGASLRDAVNRLEASVDTVRRNQAIGQDRIRAMLNDAQDGHFEADSEGAWHWTNSTLLRLLDKPHDELNGFGWVNAVSEETRDDIYQRFASAVRQHRTFEARVELAHRKAGLPWSVWVRCHPLRDAEQRVTGFFGVVKGLADEG